MRIFLFHDPIRIDGLERRPVGDGAVNLAALHREMDFRRALVAGDDLEFESEQLVGEHRIVELGRARRLRAHHDLLAPGILEHLRGRGVPDVHGLRLAIGAAEPIELDRIEAHAGRLQQRRGRHAVEGSAHHRAVERPGVVERIGHGEAAGARLILHDDGRLARNMRGQVARKQARIDVVARADADADHEPQRLAVEEGGDVFLLRAGARDGGEEDEQGEQRSLHSSHSLQSLVIARGSGRSSNHRKSSLTRAK
jgi:hypothetical protein